MINIEVCIGCNGTVVNFNDYVYTNVDKAKALDIIKKIVIMKGRESREKRGA